MKQGIPVHDTMESIGILCDEDNYLAVFFFVVARGGIQELWVTLGPASRRNGTSIRYWWPNGHFPKANGTSVRYWVILVDFLARYGSITHPRLLPIFADMNHLGHDCS